MRTRQRNREGMAVRAAGKTSGESSPGFAENGKPLRRMLGVAMLAMALSLAGAGCGKRGPEAGDEDKTAAPGHSAGTTDSAPKEPQAGDTKEVALPGGAVMVMAWCPPGKTERGAFAGFWMGTTEVTQEQWESVMGENPSQFKGDNLPVENVSWEDCQNFCAKAELRLPTEPEWEYACLAGSDGDFAGTGSPDDVGWHGGNSGMESHPVGEKDANAWGLKDMHGNVWEWCMESFRAGRHALHGGSFCNASNRCTSASRIVEVGKQRDCTYGFRVCQGGRPVKSTPTRRKASSGPDIPAGTVDVFELPGGVKMEFVWCPPGEFEMGSPGDETGRGAKEKRHTVTLTEGFWLAKYEVTRAQWAGVMGKQLFVPSEFKVLFNKRSDGGGSFPVLKESWEDCMLFCLKAGLRLPTEAQWEYACRAGSTGPYAGTGNLDEMGWYQDNAGWEPHPVGQKEPNAWGLYDMHGNAQEWCADWYGPYKGGEETNPTGPDSGEYHSHVLRGGHYTCHKDECRSARRHEAHTSVGGFRPLVLDGRMTFPAKEL